MKIYRFLYKISFLSFYKQNNFYIYFLNLENYTFFLKFINFLKIKYRLFYLKFKSKFVKCKFFMFIKNSMLHSLLYNSSTIAVLGLQLHKKEIFIFLKYLESFEDLREINFLCVYENFLISSRLLGKFFFKGYQEELCVKKDLVSFLKDLPFLFNSFFLRRI